MAVTDLTRRAFLLASAGAGLAHAAPICALNREQEIGPYFIGGVGDTTSFAAGQAGVPLRVRMQLVQHSCAPLVNAVVDVWHCDALGVYSGYDAMPAFPGPHGPHRGPPHDGPPQGPPPGDPPKPTHPERYLRGRLHADAHGIVELATIFPGWYQNRTVHVHYKVTCEGHVAHVGQLFFPEDVIAQVAQLPPYSSRLNVERTLSSDDYIFLDQGGAEALVPLMHKGAIKDGLFGSVRIGVDPSAHPAEVHGFGPPPR